MDVVDAGSGGRHVVACDTAARLAVAVDDIP
jgi:hypothetical protein